MRVRPCGGRDGIEVRWVHYLSVRAPFGKCPLRGAAHGPARVSRLEGQWPRARPARDIPRVVGPTRHGGHAGRVEQHRTMFWHCLHHRELTIRQSRASSDAHQGSPCHALGPAPYG
eukprot:scaffold12489_cov27-Tisochrysis_lutea.AAC.1